MITGCAVHYVGKTGEHYLAMVLREHLHRQAKTITLDLAVFVPELAAIKFLKGICQDQDGKTPGTYHWIEDWGRAPTFEEARGVDGESTSVIGATVA